MSANDFKDYDNSPPTVSFPSSVLSATTATSIQSKCGSNVALNNAISEKLHMTAKWYTSREVDAEFICRMVRAMIFKSSAVTS